MPIIRRLAFFLAKLLLVLPLNWVVIMCILGAVRCLKLELTGGGCASLVLLAPILGLLPSIGNNGDGDDDPLFRVFVLAVPITSVVIALIWEVASRRLEKEVSSTK